MDSPISGSSFGPPRAVAPPGVAERARLESAVGDLLGEAEGAVDAAERVDLLRQAAQIYERIPDRGKALLIWQTALGEDPASEDLAGHVERLAGAERAWPAVLADTEALVERTMAPQAREALFLLLARWHERHGGGAQAAQRWVAAAEAEAPGSLNVAEAASAFHGKRGDFQRAAAALERAAGACDPGDALGLLLEAARLRQGKLQDREGAAALFRKVLAIAPGNALAREALGELAPRAREPKGNGGGQGQGNGRQDDGASEADPRVGLHDDLERLVADKHWTEAAVLLEGLARDEDGALKARYLATAGRIAERELHDTARAELFYNRALDAHPTDARTIERLYGLFAGARAWDRAEDNLRRMIARLEALGGAAAAALVLPLWRRLGDVYRVGLKNLDAAAQAYSTCARMSPDDPRFAKLLHDIARRKGAGQPA